MCVFASMVGEKMWGGFGVGSRRHLVLEGKPGGCGKGQGTRSSRPGMPAAGRAWAGLSLKHFEYYFADM